MQRRRETAEASSESPEIRRRSGEPGTIGKKRSWWRPVLLVLFVLIVLVGIGITLMPWLVRDYVNRTLDRNPLYAGKIGEVEIHLWRGAYSIQDINISKASGNVPVPLFAARRVDFAIQWDALWEGEVVGRVVMEEPEINFVDSGDDNGDQTGTGGPWLQIIRDLFPFRINRAVVRNGAVHFRAYKSNKPVDVYLSKVEATVDNLTNIHEETKPLVATVQVTALVMDQAKFEYKMTLDPFSYLPTFRMALRVLGLEVTKINDLARTYGKFDFERGWFDLIIETESREGQITGYVKPLFRNLTVFSLRDDLKDENPLQAFWQALIGAATQLFKNQPRDQFGTLIPFKASYTGTTRTDILATIGNLLRNAFVRAYLPRLEGGKETVNGLQFSPPELHDPISVGDSEE